MQLTKCKASLQLEGLCTFSRCKSAPIVQGRDRQSSQQGHSLGNFIFGSVWALYSSSETDLNVNTNFQLQSTLRLTAVWNWALNPVSDAVILQCTFIDLSSIKTKRFTNYAHFHMGSKICPPWAFSHKWRYSTSNSFQIGSKSINPPNSVNTTQLRKLSWTQNKQTIWYITSYTVESN